MNIKYLAGLCALVFVLSSANSSYAKEVLFYRVSRNYDSEGKLGSVKRHELESRMFTHPTWLHRLYYNPYEPDIDETLEIYSKPDGSSWLSYCRATPSLSQIIFAYVQLGARFDLKRELDSAHIIRREVRLPEGMAAEISLLWRTMLPGLPKDPDPARRLIVPHFPTIIGFDRQADAVKTGRIPMAAHNTPVYRAFLVIVGDLIRACDSGAQPTDPIFSQLSDKINRLRSRFEGRSRVSP